MAEYSNRIEFELDQSFTRAWKSQVKIIRPRSAITYRCEVHKNRAPAYAEALHCRNTQETIVHETIREPRSLTRTMPPRCGRCFTLSVSNTLSATAIRAYTKSHCLPLKHGDIRSCLGTQYHGGLRYLPHALRQLSTIPHEDVGS